MSADDLAAHEHALYGDPDPNGIIGHDLLDAWQAGDAEFDRVLAQCLAEFDVALVLTQLVNMTNTLLASYEQATGLTHVEHLAMLRRHFYFTYPKETTNR